MQVTCLPDILQIQTGMQEYFVIYYSDLGYAVLVHAFSMSVHFASNIQIIHLPKFLSNSEICVIVTVFWVRYRICSTSILIILRAIPFIQRIQYKNKHGKGNKTLHPKLNLWISGWLHDITSKYEISFFFGGIVTMVSAAILLWIPVIKKIQYKNALKLASWISLRPPAGTG